MESKVMRIFYGADALPYKDKARTVHYPIIGQAFEGASGTTEIHFYVDQIGGTDTTKWVSYAKLPSGKKGYKMLDSYEDTELNENYVKLTLSQFYTQEKGDVYISLNGFDGGVELEQDSDDNYVITGTPVIQATGSVKITMQYSVQLLPSDIQEYIELDDILAYISGKADVSYVKDNFIRKIKLDIQDQDYTEPLGELLDVGVNPIIYGVEIGGDTNYLLSIRPYDSQGTMLAEITFYSLSDQAFLDLEDADLEGVSFEDLVNDIQGYGRTFAALDQIVVKTTSANKVYATNGSGTQTELDYGTGTTGNAIVQRDANGQVNVPDTPSDNNDATSKGYVLGQVQTKQDLLVSGTNIKTINNESILGSGNIDIQSGGNAEWGNITGTLSNQTDLNNELVSLHQEAEGKCKSYTISISDNASFNTQDAYISGITSITDISGNVVQISSLHNGDVILVVETNVPDRWYSSTDSKLYVLETTKVDLSGYVDLTSTQTITGTKTFTSPITLPDNNSIENVGTLLALKQGGATKLSIAQYSVNFYQSIIPSSNNTIDIGSYSYQWKDLYLSGKVNPNSSGYGYTLPSTASFTSDKTIASVEDLSGFNAYSSSQTYAVGDKVVYGGKLYRCSTAITTAESWDSTHWTEITLSDVLYKDEVAQVSGITFTQSPSTYYINASPSSMVFRAGGNSFYFLGPSIRPYDDNLDDIGSSSFRWKDLYMTGKVNIMSTSSNVNNVPWYLINSGEGDLDIFRNTTRAFRFSNTNFRPYSNNAIDLGSSSQKWRNLYLSGNISDGTNSVSVAQLSGVCGSYSTNSTTQLEYSYINNISISANTTFTLATAPANTYPEYKANITNTDTSNSITITLPSGTIIKGNVSISSNTFEIPADSSVEVNIQNQKALVMNWGA